MQVMLQLLQQIPPQPQKNKSLLFLMPNAGMCMCIVESVCIWERIFETMGSKYTAMSTYYIDGMEELTTYYNDIGMTLVDLPTLFCSLIFLYNFEEKE